MCHGDASCHGVGTALHCHVFKIDCVVVCSSLTVQSVL